MRDASNFLFTSTLKMNHLHAAFCGEEDKEKKAEKAQV